MRRTQRKVKKALAIAARAFLCYIFYTIDLLKSPTSTRTKSTLKLTTQLLILIGETDVTG